MQKAVVIGAGMAGLMAAAVLARQYGDVILLDPDRMPDGALARKAVPQGQHAHALLKSGEEVMSGLFPGFVDDLIARGAHQFRVRSQWRTWGGTGWAPPVDIGLTMMSQTRPLIEHLIPERVMALEAVSTETGRVEALVSGRSERVTGVVVAGHEIAADLVVDASGRGGRTDAWLSGAGIAPPRKSTVAPELSYTSALFSRKINQGPDFGGWLMFGHPPETRSAVALPVEGDRWLVTAADRFGTTVEAEEAAFRGFLADLPDDRFVTLLAGEKPVSDFTRYRVAQVYMRHFDETDMPDNYVPIGDVIATFNPIYAQGMSIAALQAQALADALAGGGAGGVFQRYVGRAVEVARWAWLLGQANDLGYDQFAGDVGPDVTAVSRTLQRLNAALPDHPELMGDLGQAIHLFVSPESLEQAVESALAGATP
ncbi:FAD-dependent oxidoreductase [Marimonas arenosa]|uniref:FAD-dependent oxidoreductase n=1 Tax=Marimonas arenosa TaxID=1795305 RepID=A0AAE4B4B7_9RHOB|nr:FAD-dependent oxidoreductase [Marimonas arenosa]MDQ2089239.1 FAD-dependent oxidoreductase [Marimonas arenosa]